MDTQQIKNRFGIIGNSPGLNHALDVAAQVAATDLSVLINGESGVGKEVIAQIIHTLSARKHNPFIAVNCGAIPEGTIDSELFGHEKGSFTGAVDSRKGYFETVNGGTIFLDEIGEMPLGTQARLLRVLETGEYIKVGSSKVQKTDVRVVAATNKDLLELSKQGKFRSDLYYRLNTVPIWVPALRERKEDIPLLFRKFSSDFASKYSTHSVQLSDEAMQELVNYSFPGNVRELKNIAEQISVLSTDKVVSGTQLQSFLPKSSTPATSISSTSGTGTTHALQHIPKDGGGNFANERELLYTLFFDMRKDVTELRKLFYDILQGRPPAVNQAGENTDNTDNFLQPEVSTLPISAGNTVILPATSISTPTNEVGSQNGITQHEDVDESLNIADKEKELIIKALKKNRSKRRDAAADLGISERTLYRKLKEYDIDDL